MANSGAESTRPDAWLDAFWECTQAPPPATDEPPGEALRDAWPTPGPGTLFLLVLALWTGLRQRLARRATLRPTQPGPREGMP